MLITCTNDRKAAMVVTTPAAGLLAPGTAELVVWIGATAGPDVVAGDGIRRCGEALRELQTPGAAYGAKLSTGTDGSIKSAVVAAAGAPTVTDNDVAIAYGATFNVDGTTISPVWKRAIERFLEERKAA